MIDRISCLECDGTGTGPCCACGDDYAECACPDGPESDECDTCGGSGWVEEEELES